jgi:hypothetical protein
MDVYQGTPHATRHYTKHECDTQLKCGDIADSTAMVCVTFICVAENHTCRNDFLA